MGGEPGLQVPGVEGLTFVAEGGFSTVYRGYQTQFGRWVAVKVIHTVGDPEGAARRLEREQLAMGRLSQHPNVVTVYHAGTLPGGQPYLLMDYLAAGSLAQRLVDRGPMRPAQVARVGADLAAALAVAHQLGVVHGDLKPANVLLGHEDQALLTDFGISALMDRAATGQHYLTPAYSAPEQRWQGQVLPASDVWSLGATLFVALTGDAPPQPDRQGPRAGELDVAALAAQALQRLGTPAELIDVVRRCLHSDVLGRPDTRTVQQRLLHVAGSASGPAAGRPGAPSAMDAATDSPSSPGSSPVVAPTGVIPATALAPTSVQSRYPGEGPGISVGGSAPAADAGFVHIPGLGWGPPVGDGVTATQAPPPLPMRISSPVQATPPVVAPPPTTSSTGPGLDPPGAERGPAAHHPRSARSDRARRTVLAVLSVLVVAAAAALVVLRSDGSPLSDTAGSAGTERANSATAETIGLGGPGQELLSGAAQQCLIEGVSRADGAVVVVGYTAAAPGAPSTCCPASIASSCGAGGRRNAVYRYRQDSGWQRARSIERADGRGSQELHGIIEVNGVLVAFGASWITNERDFAATAWTSTDGETWQQTFTWEPATNDGQLQALIDAATNGSAIVAVGHSGFADPAGLPRSEGVVFRATADGRQWTPVAFPRGQGVLRERVQAITWTGSAFLAGGTQSLVGGGWVQALWMSDGQGENWRQVHRSAPAAFQEIAAVAAEGSTLVAVGPREGVDSDGVVLRSLDGGTSWTEVPVGLLQAPGHQNLANLTVIGNWFVAVGAVDGTNACNDGNACTVPAVFASADGLSWQALEVQQDEAPPGHQQSTSVVADAKGTWFTLGYEENATDFDGRWWQVTPAR